MIPQIIVSSKNDKLDKYVSDFIAQNGIASYYVYKIAPLKTEITIDQIRSIKNEIITKINDKRLFVCYLFDSANLEAQNAFLKTLEEKNEQNIFLLLAKNSERILPTIRSRAKVIHLDNDNVQQMPNTRLLFSQLESVTDYSFLSHPDILNITRENAELLFDEFVYYLRNSIKIGDKRTVDIIKKVLQTKNLLLSNNLNPQLAVDSVFIFFKKTFRSLP